MLWDWLMRNLGTLVACSICLVVGLGAGVLIAARWRARPGVIYRDNGQ